MQVSNQLPVGYRFHPTDEELVVHYLWRKAVGLSLPASVIPEFDVLSSNPWTLPGDGKEKRFFFSKLKRNEEEEGKVKRPAGSGYWESMGVERKIINSENNSMVGTRRKFSFSEAKTEWIMHEYAMAGCWISETGNENWVVCKIHQRRRRGKRERRFSRETNRKIRQRKRMTLMEETPSPSCSSGVTELSFSGHEYDDEEESH